MRSFVIFFVNQLNFFLVHVSYIHHEVKSDFIDFDFHSNFCLSFFKQKIYFFIYVFHFHLYFLDLIRSFNREKNEGRLLNDY